MTNEEVALRIVHRNENIIRDRLLSDGYMFDDELDEKYISSPVARQLASCIEEYFNISDGQYVIRNECNEYERSDGLFYYSECEMSYNEVMEIAKRHYNIF